MIGGAATDHLVKPRRSSWRVVGPELGGTWLAIAGLVIVVSLSMADGLLGGIVAYERDTFVFYFPLMRWVSQQLHAGVLPLWTPQVFGGYPIFADGEIGLSYPPALLALWLIPPEQAFVFLRLLHLWIAAFGTFALARTLGLPRSAAVLAGLVFALGNFLQAQIHHENIVRTAAWMPVMLVLVERALRAADTPRRAFWTVCGGLALGMAGLALHSQMLAIDLLVLAAYAAVRWWAGPLAVSATGTAPRAIAANRFLAVAAVGLPVVILGLCLAAVQLVPLVELAGFSPRGGGIPYTESAAYSLTPYGLGQLILPFLFRGPGGLQWGLWTHWESYLYVGLTPLVLAVVGLLGVRRREVAGWGILAAVGTIVALGQYSPLNLHYLLWLVPGISGLRAPGRFTIVVVLALGMLAAYGLAWLQQHTGTSSTTAYRKLARRVVFGAIALAVGVTLAVSGAHLVFTTFPSLTHGAIDSAYLALPRDGYPLTQADVYAGLLWATDLHNPSVALAVGVLIGLTCVLAAWMFGRTAQLRRWPGWPTLLIMLASAELLIFAWGIHPRLALERLSSVPPALGPVLQAAASSPEPVRVLASPVLNQVATDRLAPFGLQDANGYSSLQFVWHRDYLARVLEVDDDLLDLWGVRYVIDPAEYGVLPRYKDVDFLPSQMVLHAPAGGADAEQSFALAPGSDVAEVRIVSALVNGLDAEQDEPVADVELRGPNAEVFARTQLLAGRDTMEWAWDSPSVRPYVRHARAELAGLAIESGASSSPRLLSFASLPVEPTAPATTLVIRAILPTGELAVFGGAVVDRNGATQELFGRTRSKYRLVYADRELRVAENTAALPRAFLVTRARTAPSIGQSLGEMIHRPFDPRREVVIAADAAPEVTARLPAMDPTGEGAAPGSAQVVDYAADAVRVRTSSPSAVLLVVTDTYYPGWRAFVDGVEQPLVRGDLLFRVVPVGPGEHVVDLRFEPLSIRVGLLISVVSLALAAGVLASAGRSMLRRRTT